MFTFVGTSHGHVCDSTAFLFFFSLTVSATSSFHHHVSLLWLHKPVDDPRMTCAVCCFHHYIFHQGISTLLPLPYLWPCFSVLLEPPCTHSWFQLFMPSFCCIKPHVNYCNFWQFQNPTYFQNYLHWIQIYLLLHKALIHHLSPSVICRIQVNKSTLNSYLLMSHIKCRIGPWYFIRYGVYYIQLDIQTSINSHSVFTFTNQLWSSNFNCAVPLITHFIFLFLTFDVSIAVG